MSGSGTISRSKLIGKIGQRLLMWSGLASGIALTLILAFLMRHAQVQSRGLIAVMIVINIAMLVPWASAKLPAWLDATLSVARGFHWIVNLIFGGLGLLFLAHANHPRSAIVFGLLAAMFVLWAAAARRLTHRDQVPTQSA